MDDFVDILLTLLQDSALGDLVRRAEYLYPILEATHILGVALLIGPAFAFDGRLLGAGRQFMSVAVAARYLLPISHIGFVIVVATGAALLSAQATTVAGAGAAPWKLGLLIVACLNVLVFHCGVYRRVATWAHDAVTPIMARLSAAVSLISWTGVLFSGRLLAYT